VILKSEYYPEGVDSAEQIMDFEKSENGSLQEFMDNSDYENIEIKLIKVVE